MTVSFAALADGTYSNCTITVTDSAGNTQTISVNTFTIDTTAPTLAQVTAVSTPTSDNTSSYTFSSDEAGNITYGGSCSSSTTASTTDNNTITFNALSDETYSNCTISVTDNANNTSDNLSVSSFTIDTTAPTLSVVSTVTNPTKDTTPNYAFSSNEAGTISYGGSCSGTTSAINGTNSISFGTLSEGSYSCTITVTDSAGNASIALSVNAFVIDTTAPTVSSVSSSTANGLFGLNDNITVTVTFNDNVIVNNSSGNPRIQLETGTNDRYANYISGNSTSVLSFLYTLQSGDNSSDLDYKGTDSFSVNSGTIRDSATNDATLTLSSPGTSGSIGANKAIVIDAKAPTVDNVSSSTTDGIYSFGDNITIKVDFNENVIIDNSSGNPRIQLETGRYFNGASIVANDRYANYVSGNNTSVLSFLYTVQSVDNSSDLDYKATDSLSANGGTIRDNASNDANLTLASPGASNSLGLNNDIEIAKWFQTVSINNKIWQLKTAYEADLLTALPGSSWVQNQLNWADANSYCSNLRMSGGGWRLPTLEELKAIRTCSYGGCYGESPFIVSELREHTHAGGPPNWSERGSAGSGSRYWSSTTYPYNDTLAYYVIFSNGHFYELSKSNQYWVRCMK